MRLRSASRCASFLLFLFRTGKGEPMKSLKFFRALGLSTALLALSAAAHAQYQMERLSRGVVAVRTSSSQVYVGWRLFGNDPSGTAFNLYRSSNGGAAMLLNG